MPDPATTIIAAGLLIGLAAVAFWIAMLRHCWIHTAPRSRERWVWLLIILVGKLPGAIAYALLRHQPVPA